MSSNRLNNIIKDRYGIDLLENGVDFDDLMMIYEHYTEKKLHLRQILGESALMTSADYSKAYLIAEAALMVLREIAPKRKKKRGS